jgi:hypothetical protein
MFQMFLLQKAYVGSRCEWIASYIAELNGREGIVQCQQDFESQITPYELKCWKST